MANKRYYWIKLKTDFFDQETIDFLLSQKNGCEYIVIYLKLCAITTNNNGELASRMGEMIVPYDVNKIVRETKYFDFDTVTVALGLFKQLGLIYEEEDRILKISGFDEMVGSEVSSAKRVREYRERQKMLQCNTNVTQEIDIDKELDIDIEKDKDKETLYDFLQQKGFVLSPFDYEIVGKWDDNSLTKHAIEEAVVKGKLSVKYVDAIIRNFKNSNIQTVEQAKETSKTFTKNKTVLETNPDWLHKEIEADEATQEEIDEFEKLLRGDE